jgi:hypothetical protein
LQRWPAPWWIEQKANINQLIDLVLIQRSFFGRAELVLEYLTLLRHQANQMALNALTSRVPAEELVDHLQFIRNLIASMVSDARYRKGGVGDGEFLLPGFHIPKGKCK